MLIVFFIFIVSIFNYIVDPYDIYKSKVLNIYKIKKHDKIRLVKAIDIQKNIKTVILGTSRATYGYNPVHIYFGKLSYNAAIPGGTMYENLIYLKELLKSNYSLKNIFLVLDYRMLNARKQKRINDFESYFNNKYLKYKYFLSYSQFKDSISTLKKNKNIKIYLENGFRKENINISKRKNQYKSMMEDESTYYRGIPTNYSYKDTQNNSMSDFKDLLLLVKNHNLNLTVIFGPSHIRLWEALDYHLDYDFSIYNKYTNEKVPMGNNEMKFFIDTNHYKESLGKLVLDYLNEDFNSENFAVKLNLYNIDSHLKNLKQDRVKYIDISNYKKIMTEYINKSIKN